MLEIKWIVAILVLVLHMFLFIQMAISFIKLKKSISKLIFIAKEKGIAEIKSEKPIRRFELLTKEINEDEANRLSFEIMIQQ